MIEGYSVQEAASVLGVPTERVWELLARGVLSGDSVTGGDMRVFLRGRPQAERPIDPAPPDPTPAGELTPFRELLTEFRSLTERYGQALLALGEARGEVSSLRGRIELLEQRVDLRLPPASPAPPIAWTPSVAPRPAPPAPEPVAEAEPAEDEPPIAAPPDEPAAEPERHRRRDRSARSAIAGLAEALARADDPVLAELPGGREAAEALAAFREDATPVAGEAEAPTADEVAADGPGWDETDVELATDAIAVPTDEEPAAEMAPDDTEPDATAPEGGREPAGAWWLEPAARDEPEPAPDEEAVSASPAEGPDLEPVDLSRVEPGAEPEPAGIEGPAEAEGEPELELALEDAADAGAGEASLRPGSPYTTAIEEPDWWAEGDVDASSTEPEQAPAEAEPGEREHRAEAAEPEVVESEPEAAEPEVVAPEAAERPSWAASLEAPSQARAPRLYRPPANPEGRLSSLLAPREPAGGPVEGGGQGEEGADADEEPDPGASEPAWDSDEVEGVRAMLYRAGAIEIEADAVAEAEHPISDDERRRLAEAMTRGRGIEIDQPLPEPAPDDDAGDAAEPAPRSTIDEALAALDALARGEGTPEPSWLRERRSPASRAYRRLRRIFPP